MRLYQLFRIAVPAGARCTARTAACEVLRFSEAWRRGRVALNTAECAESEWACRVVWTCHFVAVARWVSSVGIHAERLECRCFAASVDTDLAGVASFVGSTWLRPSPWAVRSLLAYDQSPTDEGMRRYWLIYAAVRHVGLQPASVVNRDSLNLNGKRACQVCCTSRLSKVMSLVWKYWLVYESCHSGADTWLVWVVDSHPLWDRALSAVTFMFEYVVRGRL